MDQEMLIAAIERKKAGFKIANERRVRELKARTHEEWLKSLPYVFKVRETDPYLFQEAADIQKVLMAAGLDFCFIGGVALQLWGEVRNTKDIDLQIHRELGSEDEALKVLLSYLEPRNEDYEAEFARYRVFFGRAPSGFQVDVFVGYTPYERRLTTRAKSLPYGVDVPLRICAAEDLIVTKTIAGRDQDWVDIQRVIQRSGETMDWLLVFEELETLLALYHEEDRLPRLKQMILNEYPDGLPGVPPPE